MHFPEHQYEQSEQIPAETPLWRYMRLDELLGMLVNGRLWLSCIASMTDQREGLFFCDSTHDQQLHAIARRIRLGCYVSCWSALPSESMALWESHADERGLVVKSDAKSLMGSLGPDGNNTALHRVVYRDQAPDLEHFRLSGVSLTDALLFKHEAFSYEKEVRLVSNEFGRSKAPSVVNLNLQPAQRNQGVTVDLQELIHEIRVSPYAAPWLLELIEVTLQRFQLGEKPVRCSELAPSFGVRGLSLSVPRFKHGPPSQQLSLKQKGIWEKTDYGYCRIEYS